MPFSIATDDEILRLPYTYHGPVIDVSWLPFTLRFRGRPLPEWLALFFSMIVLWPAVDLVLAALAGAGLDILNGPTWAVVHWAVSWTISSQIAAYVYLHAIDTDRSVGYLANTVATEIRRWRWAHGPVDRMVVLAGVVPWLAVNRALGFLPVPRPVLWVAAGFIVCPVARRLVGAFESSDRARRRILERAYRAGTATIIAGEPL